jgi:hypothetical protein
MVAQTSIDEMRAPFAHHQPRGLHVAMEVALYTLRIISQSAHSSETSLNVWDKGQNKEGKCSDMMPASGSIHTSMKISHIHQRDPLSNKEIFLRLHHTV